MLDDATARDLRVLRAARGDLEAGPAGSRLARAVVEQAAVDFAAEEQRPIHALEPGRN
jgi:hypothetical protein